MEPKQANLGAFKIADSVTYGNRLQSYIASRSPFWLDEFFWCERKPYFCVMPFILGFLIVSVSCIGFNHVSLKQSF